MKKRKDNLMKYSMKHQMIIMFAGLTVGILSTMFVLNAWLLQPFYVRDKQKAFIEMYDEIVWGMQDSNGCS